MVEKGYIDRELAFDMITDLAGMATTKAAYAAIWRSAKQLNEVPTADVAPVKHGHWIKGKGYERPTENGFVHDDKYICDCCGWGCCCDTKLDFRYCPNCGAKNGR